MDIVNSKMRDILLEADKKLPRGSSQPIIEEVEDGIDVDTPEGALQGLQEIYTEFQRWSLLKDIKIEGVPALERIKTLLSALGSELKKKVITYDKLDL